jgi:hypothetical protein
MQVGDPGASRLDLSSCNPLSYSIGASVNGLAGSRFTLSNNGLTTIAIAPGTSGKVAALFSGLVNGASYEVTVATQPTNPSQSCVVTNGKGTIAASNVEISVSCTSTPARFLLAQNKLGASQLCLTVAAIDSDSGVLTTVAAPPLCGPLRTDEGGILGAPLGPMVADRVQPESRHPLALRSHVWSAGARGRADRDGRR